jgi:hypothetical protein
MMLEIPKEVVLDAVKWAREAGGPAYDEDEEWCSEIAALASYLPEGDR